MKLMEEQLSPTPPLPPQKPNPWVWIGVCVVMLAVGIGIGLFLAKNIYPPLQILPAPTPTPVAIADPTANWKIYTDPSNTFSFKYPMNLTDLKDQGGVSGPWTGNPQSIINLGDKMTIRWGTDAPYDGFSVYTVSKLVSLSLLDYLHKEVEAAKNSPRGIKSGTITETSLGGQTAAFIDSTVIHREYFIPSPDGKKIVVFSRINSTDSFLNTFDQILSTFRFVEATPNQPIVTSPVANSKILSPLIITGTVPAGWMFEGVFPIKLMDADKKFIAQGQGKETVPGSWTSEKAIDFSATLTFTTTAKSGFIVLGNDNASGLPEKNIFFEIPVTF